MYDELCGTAINRLHLSAMEFYDLTPVEFHFAIEDNNTLELQMFDSFRRTVYDSMRLQTAMIVNTNPYVKQKIKDPRKLIEFEWERREKIQDGKELKNALMRMAKMKVKKE